LSNDSARQTQSKKRCVEPPLDKLKTQSFDGQAIAKRSCAAGFEIRAPTAKRRPALSRPVLKNYTRGSLKAMRAFGVLLRIAPRRRASFDRMPCESMLRRPERDIFATGQKSTTKWPLILSKSLRKSVKYASDAPFGFLIRKRLKQGPFACAPKRRAKNVPVCVFLATKSIAPAREKAPRSRAQ
jgi:hypothetical protein